MDNLNSLAKLIKNRNLIDKEISKIIDRPAEKGHIAEFIAFKVFPIKMHENKSTKDFDGFFTDGDLKGKKVDIKYHSVNEYLLNLNSNVEYDVFLLVFTGPYKPAASSKGQTRPFCISNVYLFNEMKLCEELRGERVKVGVAASVKKEHWDNSEVFPNNRANVDLKMNDDLIRLFLCKISELT